MSVMPSSVTMRCTATMSLPMRCSPGASSMMAMLVSYHPVRKDGTVPTPEKTTRDGIVAAGRALVEVQGVAGLAMQAGADAVGVRAPSLYKRVRDRDELLELVVAATIDDLTDRL